MFDLKSKIAIVTGASSGLGADAARAYAEHGAGVALLARRKDKLAKELEENGTKAIAIQCDVADETSVASAVEEVIDCFGKVDILLNNAGIAVGGSVTSLTQEAWQRSMDINVKGIYLTCKYVIPHMQKQSYGKIVNVSSVNAFKADKNKLFYPAFLQCI